MLSQRVGELRRRCRPHPPRPLDRLPGHARARERRGAPRRSGDREPGEPDGNGQNTSTLLGSILRIEVDSDEPYEIPPGNPFADGEGAPEIHLYGVRNPWRFSFDRETDDLWIGDVGQNTWEEIDLLPAASGMGRGANLGWNEMEGAETFEGGNSPPGAVEPLLT